MIKIKFSANVVTILAITFITSGATIGSAAPASKAPIEKIQKTNGYENVGEHNPKFVDGEMLVSFKNDTQHFRVVKVPAVQVNA